MMNVVISTTRQWNPGDEFIMMGCINLLKEHIGTFNPIIFNRNPQTRRARKYDFVKQADRLLGGEVIEKFLDNSVKNAAPISYADLVVFAGSPEWRGLRLEKLYAEISQLDIPTIFLGIGTSGRFSFEDNFTETEKNVFKNAKLITCRDALTKECLDELNVEHLPCPALFSSTNEKKVDQVKRIGIIYGTHNAVKNNNISLETEEYLKKTYHRFINENNDVYDIEFIAHYIDELDTFNDDFPGQKLRYSYDSKDYLDIFGSYDLVIGHRVHGIGMSASMGIPGIMIAHDARASTVKGFLAKMICVGDSYEDFSSTVNETINNISYYNETLIEHKEKTKAVYIDLLKKTIPIR